MPSQQHGGHGGGDALAGRLEPLVSEAVNALGFELDSLAVQLAGRRKLVRVVIDSDTADAPEEATESGTGVDLDEVAEVSRAVSKVLDARDDLLAGPYTLEVTSPGVDRPLTKPRHWRRAWSRLVRLREPDGTTRSARVGTAHEQGVDLLVDGTLSRWEYADIAAATVEVEFRKPPAKELEQLRGESGGTKEEPK